MCTHYNIQGKSTYVLKTVKGPTLQSCPAFDSHLSVKEILRSACFFFFFGQDTAP